ncbi:hypothetical protein BpHYR1_027386 [Brachionus plicatilis]|uniref:Uncharacterized protein n=1 Tax=Brachionus plicatilis TaxID=10195 RepID=A0A3M7PCY5_BRAPC|nr:hypothetical protein BpHYR1_027386 [Brachionus plicatilis]
MLKLHQCNDIVCGICGNNNGNPFDDFLNRSGYIVQIVERALIILFNLIVYLIVLISLLDYIQSNINYNFMVNLIAPSNYSHT